jgi:hypothetical protein
MHDVQCNFDVMKVHKLKKNICFSEYLWYLKMVEILVCIRVGYKANKQFAWQQCACNDRGTVGNGVLYGGSC